jgi:response regulator RpfG family c-di-GMP phosphodiesterase
LLDIQMPSIDGLEIAKYIKTNKKLKNITTIGLSAFPLTYNSDFRSVYLDDFVPKPLNINLLLRKMVKFLEIADDIIKSKTDKKLPYGKSLIEEELLKKFDEARIEIIKPALRQMSNSSSFRDYESFGKTLKRVGEEVQISRLTLLGTAIIEAVKTFDLESLAKLVADYKLFEKKLLNKTNEAF